MGGRTTREVYKNMDWQEVEMPFRIVGDSCGLALNNHEIVVIGGVFHENKTDVLDTSTGDWREMADVPEGRWYF